VSEARLCTFLTDSLALWGVEGTVERGEPPALAVVRAAGHTLYVERAPQEIPFRWLVRDERSTPCGSLLGVLTVLRRTLGVERGTAVRVAPRP
jgi:hypothetical protein